MLTLEQVDFLLALINQVGIPGQVLDLAYGTKQALMGMKVELSQGVPTAIESKRKG